MHEKQGRAQMLSRRRLLRLAAVAGGTTAAGVLLAACGETQVVEVEKVITREVVIEKIVKEQVPVEVEKIVRQEVERVVTREVEVEKIVRQEVEVPVEVERLVTVQVVKEVQVQREIVDIAFWDFETRPLGVAAQDAWFARAGTEAGVRMNREVIPFRETEPKILAAKATNTLPDMLWSQPDATWSWAGQEIVTSADSALDRIGRSNFGQNDLDATMVDGVAYGVPQFLWPHILYYRTDLYAENSLPDPTTWDTIVANATALNNPPDIYGYYTYLGDAHPKLAWSLMPAHDAYVFDQDGNNSINSPGTIAALKLAKALDDVSADGAPSRDEGAGRGEFIRGATAHMVSSTSFSGTFLADKPEMLDRVAAVAQPTVAGTGAGLAGMNILNITTQTPYPDRMVDFFAALFNRDNYQEWFQSTVVGWAPTHRVVQESDDYWGHPRIAPVAHIIRAGVAASQQAWVGGSKFGSQGSGLLGIVTARSIVKDMFIRVIQGESPEEAVQWAEEEVQKVIDENS